MEPSASASDANVRPLILDLFAKTRIDWGFASDRIAETFRRERRLHSSERREVAETLYGMIRQMRRLDHALAVANSHIPPGPRRELARYVAYRVLHDGWSTEQAKQIVADVEWSLVRQIDDVTRRERDAVLRFGLLHSLPDWLSRRFISQFGDDADRLAQALNERAPLTVRANRMMGTREALAEKLRAESAIETTPTKWAADGLTLETRVNVFGLKAFQDGLFEVQDEASQLVAELCAPPVRGTVVDACAGAGGKTLALGALMEGKGRLIAIDIGGRKLEELRKRARRAGIHNVQAIETEETSWPDQVLALAGKIDRVLVDAPCSGIGALRRNPEARWRLQESDLGRLRVQQESLFARALELVGEGGRVVYATCTILDEENEQVVQRVLAKAEHKEPGAWERVGPVEVFGRQRGAAFASKNGAALEMLPHVHGTDGFFAAVVRRKRKAG
jgi:16S rRNA (cytosine967-C5)-methyltransferase